MADAWIIDACLTPRGIGKAGKGALSGIHPQQLGATVLRALAERTGIDTADVDDIVWGTSAQLGPQSGDLGRMSALDAGYDVRASAVTLDRFCGSGITSVSMAANAIMSGAEDLVIAGGTEMMSMEGRRGGGPFMMDAGNLRLRARHPQSHQGVCAQSSARPSGSHRPARILRRYPGRRVMAQPCRRRPIYASCTTGSSATSANDPWRKWRPSAMTMTGSHKAAMVSMWCSISSTEMPSVIS